MSARLPVPRLVASDQEALERRARALASGEGEESEPAGVARLVGFHLGPARCALPTSAVERAVVALVRPMGVPLADGGERAIAFVDEVALPVADLAGLALGRCRPAPELAGSPAIVVPTARGPVAVAVDGPLDLLEDRVAAEAREQAAPSAAAIQVAARLGRGGSLLDAAWLADWAAGTSRA